MVAFMRCCEVPDRKPVSAAGIICERRCEPPLVPVQASVNQTEFTTLQESRSSFGVFERLNSKEEEQGIRRKRRPAYLLGGWIWIVAPGSVSARHSQTRRNGDVRYWLRPQQHPALLMHEVGRPRPNPTLSRL